MTIEPYRLITDRIRHEGPISFDTFMELALYSEQGYYSNKSNIGFKGDYYTSPTLHPVFSAFLASQIIYIWEYLEKPDPFNIVELGCGSGILAQDIMKSFLGSKVKIYDSLQYYAVDRIVPVISVDKINFIESHNPPDIKGTGVIIANELFDSFPVKRFQIVSGRPHEILVGISNQNELIEVMESKPVSSSMIDNLSKFNLPEGYKGVLNPDLDIYFENLAKTLDKGFFITFDYGYEEYDYYSLDRSNKHIQTYFKHVDGLGLLDNIGDQDITSHVNFTDLINSGVKSGFEPVSLKSQSAWMEDMYFYDVLKQSDFSLKETRLINSLLDVESLGGFLMSIQQKNVDSVKYSNIIPSKEYILDNLSIPEINKSHMAYQIKSQGFYGL